MPILEIIKLRFLVLGHFSAKKYANIWKVDFFRQNSIRLPIHLNPETASRGKRTLDCTTSEPRNLDEQYTKRIRQHRLLSHVLTNTIAFQRLTPKLDIT